MPTALHRDLLPGLSAACASVCACMISVCVCVCVRARVCVCACVCVSVVGLCLHTPSVNAYRYLESPAGSNDPIGFSQCLKDGKQAGTCSWNDVTQASIHLHLPPSLSSALRSLPPPSPPASSFPYPRAACLCEWHHELFRAWASLVDSRARRACVRDRRLVATTKKGRGLCAHAASVLHRVPGVREPRPVHLRRELCVR